MLARLIVKGELFYYELLKRTFLGEIRKAGKLRFETQMTAMKLGWDWRSLGRPQATSFNAIQLSLS